VTLERLVASSATGESMQARGEWSAKAEELTVEDRRLLRSPPRFSVRTKAAATLRTGNTRIARKLLNING